MSIFRKFWIFCRSIYKRTCPEYSKKSQRSKVSEHNEDLFGSRHLNFGIFEQFEQFVPSWKVRAPSVCSSCHCGTSPEGFKKLRQGENYTYNTVMYTYVTDFKICNNSKLVYSFCGDISQRAEPTICCMTMYLTQLSALQVGACFFWNRWNVWISSLTSHAFRFCTGALIQRRIPQNATPCLGFLLYQGVRPSVLWRKCWK